MKRTGAVILSMMMVMVLTVTNLAGAYQTAARVYAAEEETIGGGDNQEGESNEPQGQDAAGGLGDPTTSIAVDTTTVSAGEGENATNPQNPVPGQGDSQALSTGTVVSTPEPAPVTIFTVSFDANGHGTAPGAVSVVAGECIEKPADLSADGFLFTGWYRDANAMSAWNFDVDTVNGDITLYAGWAENIQRALQNTPVLRNGNTDVYSVTVTSNGYGSVEASPTSGTEGTEVTLTAKPQSGFSFDKWEVISGGITLDDANSQSTTFKIGTEYVEVKAIFKYDPTNHFIKIDPSLANLKFGKPVTLRLSDGGLSNGAITWESTDPSTLSINGTEATFHKTGTVRITASQAAYGEFAAVTDSLEVTIGKGDASSIDWPTLGPVYYKMSIVDIPISGGSTEWGTFSLNNASQGMNENSKPGTTTGWSVVFTPKAELASYFEANISQWVTYTVQARDTLDSCISVSPNTIDFGTVEQKNLDTVSEKQVIVFNRTDLSAAAVFVNITPGDNEYFRVRNASGGSTASPNSQIMFQIEPKTTLTPGTYEVPITFTAATSTESVEKILTAKIVVTDNLPEASVTISPNITQFSLMEGYDPDKYAQTITLTNTGTEPLEITDYTFKGGQVFI